MFLTFGNLLFVYIFVAAFAVAVFSGGWVFKERYWPSRGREPQWIRELGLES
jgi:hypothetical protein